MGTFLGVLGCPGSGGTFWGAMGSLWGALGGGGTTWGVLGAVGPSGGARGPYGMPWGWWDLLGGHGVQWGAGSDVPISPTPQKMVTALDKNWHPEHFCCVKCGQPFGEEGWWPPCPPPQCPLLSSQIPSCPPMARRVLVASSHASMSLCPHVSPAPHWSHHHPHIPTSLFLHPGPTTVAASPVSPRLTSPTTVSPHLLLAPPPPPSPHCPRGVPQASWRRMASSTAARTSPSSSPAGAGAAGGPSWRATSPPWRGSGTPSASSAG